MFDNCKKKKFYDVKFLKVNNRMIDLSLIQPRVYAMSFPAKGLRALCMNDYRDINQFIKQENIKQFCVINLCKERKYQYEYEIWKNNSKKFGIEQYSVPQLRLLVDFIQEIGELYKNNQDMYFFIHSVYGGGRTALICCCLIIYLNQRWDCQYLSAYELFIKYNKARNCMKNSFYLCGQYRYLRYYMYLVNEKQIYKSKYKEKILDFPKKHLKSIQSKYHISWLSIEICHLNKKIKRRGKYNYDGFWEYKINSEVKGDFVIKGTLEKPFILPLNTIDKQLFFEQEEIDWYNQYPYPQSWIRLIYQ